MSGPGAGPPPPTAKLMDPVLALARQAGARILDVYRTDFEVQEKDDRSPLTEADLAAHRVLVDGLRALHPPYPALSEESRSVPFAERGAWTSYWLIDPLDGTREFVKRNGEFTVNVALVHGARPVLGVVYAPVLGQVYYAWRAGGAWRARDGEVPERIRVCPRARQPLKVAGSRSHAGSKLAGYLARLGPHELVSMGSSLKLCLVAEGSVDVYPRLGPTSEWDTAAAQCVVEEAGGRVTDLQLRPLRYNTRESLLNPHFVAFGDPQRDWSAPA